MANQEKLLNSGRESSSPRRIEPNLENIMMRQNSTSPMTMMM